MKSDENHTFAKYSSLVLLIVQTTVMVLVLRYSRVAETRVTADDDEKQNHSRYLSSTAIVCSEIMKILACLVVIWMKSRYSLRAIIRQLDIEIVRKPLETLKLLVPACLYTCQNNLLFLALSNLDAATYQVTIQVKILTTAMFSRLMLGKKLNSKKKISLALLMFGVILVQVKTHKLSQHLFNVNTHDIQHQ